MQRIISATILLALLLAAAPSRAAGTSEPRGSGTAALGLTKLIASDGAAQDRLGISVAVSGDTAVVGAPGESAPQQGAAYVFTRVGGAWIEQAKLTASDEKPLHKFGFSVAISGDTVVVSAPQASVDGKLVQGAAYVFSPVGTAWTEQAKLTASYGLPGDLFGYSVGVSGDTAVVGAIWAKVGASFHQGAVYAFTRAEGIWTEQVKLIASDGAIADEFGHSVAISGDTAVVGALAGDGLNPNQGSAYVFTRARGTWAEQAKLTASDGASDDWLRLLGVGIRRERDRGRHHRRRRCQQESGVGICVHARPRNLARTGPTDRQRRCRRGSFRSIGRYLQ